MQFRDSSLPIAQTDHSNISQKCNNFGNSLPGYVESIDQGLSKDRRVNEVLRILAEDLRIISPQLFQDRLSEHTRGMTSFLFCLLLIFVCLLFLAAYAYEKFPQLRVQVAEHPVTLLV